MKSPISGEEMQIQSRLTDFTFKRKKVKIDYEFYVCPSSGKEFTNTELDERNINKVKTNYISIKD